MVTKFSNDVHDIKCKDDVLAVLIHLGYLYYKPETRRCYIPNFEVMQEMENAVEDSRWRIAKTITDSCDLLDATLDGDADYVARAIDQALTTKHTSDWYNVFQSELIADCTDFTGIGERLSPVDGSGTCPCATRRISIYKGLATFHTRCSRNCQ